MSSYDFIDLSKFPDCNALTEMGKCTRLSVSRCKGGECHFRKTSEEDFHSIQSGNHRLSRLGSIKQVHIAKKYYRGSMPWNEK